MKTPAELTQEVERRLTRTWAAGVLSDTNGTPEHDAPDGRGDEDGAAWPHAFSLGRVSSADLANGFSAFLTARGELRQWAGPRGVQLALQERRVAGTTQQIPTHATVASLDAAADLVGGEWPARLTSARRRAHALTEKYPHAATPRTLTAVTRLSDLDFDLLCRAADWFKTNSGAGMTPRQVPIEGLHAKWLNTRHKLVAELAGREDLELLPPHPARIHFTYLDPNHRARGGRVHDSATVGDVTALGYPPRVVVISENKDTAIHFPPVAGGIAIEGVGRGGGTIASFDWVRDAECLFYWGDMDADGLEILDEFRAAGVPAQSLFMDMASYERWCRYGTNLDPKGQALKGRAPAPAPNLTAPERELYLRLCAYDFTGPRRVEQERIPLAMAADAVREAARR